LSIALQVNLGLYYGCERYLPRDGQESFDLGQYVFYRSLLARYEPERKLYLAIPFTTFVNTFEEPIARPVIEDLELSLIAFDPAEERIVKWET